MSGRGFFDRSIVDRAEDLQTGCQGTAYSSPLRDDEYAPTSRKDIGNEKHNSMAKKWAIMNSINIHRLQSGFPRIWFFTN
jgi:hypothetical protein